MKYFDVDKIENDIEELKTELRKILITDQSYFVRLTGVSKQHIHRFVHTGQAMSLERLIHIYKCIQGDGNGMDKC